MHNFTPTDVGFFLCVCVCVCVSKCVKWVPFSILEDFTHANVVTLM